MSQDALGTVDWKAVRDVLDQRNIRLVLAFPGTGKTTCVKGMRSTGKVGGQPVVADLDIKGLGNDRANLDLLPKSQSVLGQLANQLMSDGVIVFSFLHYLNTDRINPNSGKVLVTIPEATADEWADRVKARGDSDEFVSTVRNHFDEWHNDWERATKALSGRLDVTVVPVKADQYLSDAILSLATD